MRVLVLLFTMRLGVCLLRLLMSLHLLELQDLLVNHLCVVLLTTLQIKRLRDGGDRLWIKLSNLLGGKHLLTLHT